MNQYSPWRSILSSSTFYNSVFFAFSSLAVAFANLLLARYLPILEYALATLAITLLNLGALVAPAGIDGVVNRKSVVSGPWLLTRTLVTSAAVGLGMVIFAALIYDLSAAIVLWLLTGTIAGGATTVAAAKFQNAQRFMWSLSIAHICNAFLLLASLTVAFLRHQSPQLPIGLMVVGYGLAASLGWWRLFKQSAFADNSVLRFSWDEGLPYAGINASALLLLQLERLLIPKLLPLEDLAVFGILAAVVIGPFRVLQLGVGYTLFPKLCTTMLVSERRRLVTQELMSALLLILLVSAAIHYFAPLVVHAFLSEQYELSSGLVMAGIVTGVLKVLGGIGKATATALGGERELMYLNLLMWISVLVGAAGAIFGATWGLTGVIYGVGLGWIGRIYVCSYIARPLLAEQPANSRS
jgi:O-antigen/teichoic acid export membrane protein